MLFRPLQIHRTPMAQQFKREYMQFPSNSVEATPLRLTKFQRKSCNNGEFLYAHCPFY